MKPFNGIEASKIEMNVLSQFVDIVKSEPYTLERGAATFMAACKLAVILAGNQSETLEETRTCCVLGINQALTLARELKLRL